MVEPNAGIELRYFDPETLRRQMESILLAWGAQEDYAKTTAEVLLWADMSGVESHGVSMIPVYDRRRRNNQMTLEARGEVVQRGPTTALIDGHGGLGHPIGKMAMQLCMEMAKEHGVGSVAVRNSSHYGAAGYYSQMAARQDLIGFTVTSGSAPRVTPTFGAEPKFSTNPLAFAVPAGRNPQFNLDMATSTVANGRIRNQANEGLPLPRGWATDSEGRPTTDVDAYAKGGMMTPLGGTPELSSHKGYGLAAMVEILSCGLSGASLVTSEGHTRRTPGSMELGHFFMAIDPALFRPLEAFKQSVDDLIDDLHATKPIDPAQPVMVADEPQVKNRTLRAKTGIPIPPGLLGQVRDVARNCNVEFLLE
ncbi:MAG: Ldh family oxidoreductase [Acetobacterales bacterium]